MDHKQLLKKLGGPHAVHSALVARGIMIKPVSVRAWALGPRNIPSKYWVPIKEIPDSQGVPVSFEDLADAVTADRQSVVSGKRVSVRVDLGGLRIINKTKN